ncbi:hypothetical protein DL764_007175 [Monosporascus ibericus]|uniref:Uncharacterized protein n=1 Tax=Monosporascus ibericus TaxID=155417 RepID=A0A4Q4T610_9PEZI|nr:hypothetical protein DL764_007175 [Monosporascus ibericus]
MQRAVNSCLLTFEPVISRDKRTIALPELTDAGTSEASFGSNKSVVAAKFGDKVDLGSPPVGWDAPDLQGEFGCSPGERPEHRATAVSVLLWGHAAALLSDAQVVKMTHGLLAHFLTEFEAPKFGAVVRWGPLEALLIPVSCRAERRREPLRDLGEPPTEESPYNLDPNKRLSGRCYASGATRRILRRMSDIEATFHKRKLVSQWLMVASKRWG